jgi:uncharacterized protein DUF5916
VAAAQRGPLPAKEAGAVAIEGRPPAIDGRLDDSAWTTAHWISDFQDKEPVEGAEPSVRTEVAFLYDDDALYVGARLAEPANDPAPRPVTRRDQMSNAEHLVISLDTYHDRRTGVSFVVSSGGVRSDYFHPGDSEGNRDYGFDPVWQAKVSHQADGWTAEMRIPFSQLRFNRVTDQVWGLNINRWIPARNEDIYWVVIPKAETGFFSRFGTLNGIRGIRPARRLEITPYAAGDARYRQPPAGDPFHGSSAYEGRAGADLKMGLGPNLTLDATVNPDFGQVEADPAVVNLTAFETFFPERRPFFLEGGDLLRGNGPGYFYSRRIGGAPRLTAAGTYTDAPDHSTIVGAAKLSGRLASGLSLGTLFALTDREVARTYDSVSGRFGRSPVAPLSGFGVVRAQQEFGSSASTVGVMLTGLERHLAPGSALAAVYNRRAYTGGADWILRWQGGAYEIGGFAGWSYVAGDTAAIAAAQTASQRYFQRPDQHYVGVDSTRTSLAGYTAALRFNKNAGTHWLYGVGGGVESPGFELNDMGRLQGADDLDAHANLRYRETRPGSLFHRWYLATSADANWNFGGTRTASRLGLSSFATFRNYWGTFVGLNWRPGELSDLLTRGGPLMRAPGSWEASADLFSSEASGTVFSGDVSAGSDDAGGWDFFAGIGISLRPLPALALSFDPSWARSLGSRQYLGTFSGGSPATYGGRYVFGYIEQSTISARVRANYAITPDLTFEAYLEPFAASGRYRRIGELRAARSGTIRRYGTDGTTIARQPDRSYLVTDNGGADSLTIDNPDFNGLSFRSNLVLRWEWRRGSTFFLVWQQNRNGDGPAGRRARLGNLWDAFGAKGENFLAVKVTYWLAVN